MAGAIYFWTEITEAPDGTPLVASYTYDGTFGVLTGVSQPYSQADGTVGARSYSWGYSLIEEADGTNLSLPVLQLHCYPFRHTGFEAHGSRGDDGGRLYGAELAGGRGG